jgi:hypothetical protein
MDHDHEQRECMCKSEKQDKKIKKIMLDKRRENGFSMEKSLFLLLVSVAFTGQMFFQLLYQVVVVVNGS